MSSSEKIAIAAHLHVLLRRKTGRVTDTEWMASNLDYAREITRFARLKAEEEGHADLAAWADKLEEIMAIPVATPRIPLVTLIATAASTRKLPTTSSVPVASQQGTHVIDTEREDYPESGFIESTFGSFFGEGAAHEHKKQRGPDAPRYVRGLR